ncbi:MAG: hypothetical protein ACLQIQ_09995 [Beijerinckiaceae bacterium]
MQANVGGLLRLRSEVHRLCWPHTRRQKLIARLYPRVPFAIVKDSGKKSPPGQFGKVDEWYLCDLFKL